MFDKLSEPAKRALEKILVQRTGQLMYEMSTLYPAISGVVPQFSWHAGYCASSDGLPYIGSHRNYPRHLFALGLGRDNLAASSLASRVLVRLHADQPRNEDELFGFGR